MSSSRFASPDCCSTWKKARSDPGPDGLTPLDEQELLAEATHEFVGEQYDCWNKKLLPALAEHRIRVHSLADLNDEQREVVDDYCRNELDALLTPVTVDPAHPFPRVIHKALCQALLLRRRRRAAANVNYMGVVTVPRALPRLVRLPDAAMAIPSLRSPTWSGCTPGGCIAAMKF